MIEENLGSYKDQMKCRRLTDFWIDEEEIVTINKPETDEYADLGDYDLRRYNEED